MNTIIDYLDHWAGIQPDRRFSSFLDVNGKETETYTYAGFNERSRRLAEFLIQQGMLKHGERVLLVYPPGLEIIAAFAACTRIGLIPVPVYPPMPLNFARSLEKLAFVLRDCDARAVLTTRELYRSYRMERERSPTDSLLHNLLALPNLAWLTTDDVSGAASPGLMNDPGSILFLQYTSGSTSDPKGVIVSHQNVIHNCRATVDHIPTAVCWLPQYHDMGLIGYYVYLIITGGTTYGFSPMDFLKRPVLWLQTLSRFKATYSSSPNFGFEYCLREDRLPAEQLSGLDLSSVSVLMSGAEPVQPDTYQRFLERFGPYGLKPQACVVAYGLAENTLAVTHYGRRILTVNKRLLQQGKAQAEDAHLLDNNQLRLVSCGRPLDGIHLRIVDPENRAVLSSGQIGEIWLSGQSTCQGYWNRPELTQEVFHNSVANDPADQNAYLRTGDLGFLENGELFVCGRIKDLIIIHGVNYYPQDIEGIVETTSQKIRRGSVAAFGGNEAEETLVVVVGVRDASDLPDAARIRRALRTRYNIEPHTIVYTLTGEITKTTSGKIARGLIRKRWLNGELPAVAAYVSSADQESTQTLPSGLRARFQHILASYNLQGNETDTLAEVGIDSLSMVQLLLELQKLLEEQGCADLAREIDGRLLQRLTVSELFSLTDIIETVSDGPAASLQVVLKQLKQEYDDQEREGMQADVQIGSIHTAGLSENTEPLTHVLMTGATGFFGPFLLSSLLQQTPYTYYVITRASDPISGMERIYDSLRSACLWTPALAEELKKRVQIVCGDITQPNLGMSAEQWLTLSNRIQAVIHNAAMVNYVQNYAALKPHNVNGTRELLRFSCTGTKKEFHFISSTIIFGWTAKIEMYENENNADMLNLDFGYAQSKWVAEQLVFAAGKQGLHVRIYRPAFLSASSQGIANKEDIVIRLLAFMINHGIAVNMLNQVSLLPADTAANNIAAIFKQRITGGETLHVTTDNYYNMADITRLITREYGYPFVYYEVEDFVAELTRRCAKDNPLYPLLDFIKRSYMKLAAMQHKRYNNSRYREARQQSAGGDADPLLKETVSYLMTYMLREGIIA